ncbi:hypothetical protein [Neisseria sp. P0019.S003]|uniref:hypothetical protein n=1 Tax=Neisseria sp. P0019.S003 TaxID=3436799 RepID=UPI003F8000DD
MNPIRLTLLISAAALLAACATTPEQKTARAQAQKRYEQDLQVHLAAQCDQETAALIRRKFDEEGKPGAATAEQKAFRLKYIDKVSDPMFQACYKMAWQNYISQEQLREARYYRYYDDWGYPFGRYPWWW